MAMQVFSRCSVVPVTTPGLLQKVPICLGPELSFVHALVMPPKLMPWLIRYLSHANDKDTRRIASGLRTIVGDALEQHLSITSGTPAQEWVIESDYTFAYADRAAFEAEKYVWDRRRDAGFTPALLEGRAVRDYEPNLGPDVGLLAVMQDHGYVRDPAGYVAALAHELQKLGGQIQTADVKGFEFSEGRVSGLKTDRGPIPCSEAVLATGVWSKPLVKSSDFLCHWKAKRISLSSKVPKVGRQCHSW